MSNQKHLLIVEDEMKFAKMVKMRLESVGYSVSAASDTYAGTMQIIKGDHDFILLDLTMLAGGGFSLLERIRKLMAESDLPVIVITGSHIDDQLRTKAKELGITAIFSKPFNDAKFVEFVRSFVPV